jgi:hypothetical protein
MHKKDGRFGGLCRRYSPCQQEAASAQTVTKTFIKFPLLAFAQGSDSCHHRAPAGGLRRNLIVIHHDGVRLLYPTA